MAWQVRHARLHVWGCRAGLQGRALKGAVPTGSMSELYAAVDVASGWSDLGPRLPPSPHQAAPSALTRVRTAKNTGFVSKSGAHQNGSVYDGSLST